MLFNTHIHIGNYLYSLLAIEQTKVISKQAFIYGNVKPDLLRKHKNDQHTFSKSRYGMLTIMDHLTGRFGEIPKSNAESAVLLGTLCHFITDMFCRYHHDTSLYSDLRYHFQYEVSLHQRFLKMKEQGLLVNPFLNISNMHQNVNSLDISINPQKSIQSHDLLNLLINQLETYDHEKPSFDLDIDYALRNCGWVMERLMPFLCNQSARMPQLINSEPEFVMWRDAI